MSLDIGIRMKSYEIPRVLEKGAVIIRVDGKSFHTWTNQVGAIKPFDTAIIACMTYASIRVSESMQGFRLAYTQSDESTFLLANEGEKEELWFGGKLDKLVSITASMFTYYFNERFNFFAKHYDQYVTVPAFFDARAFNIPIEDAANCFYWRQIDWLRNSISMLGRAHFSHKELSGKSVDKVKEMLLKKGIDWEDCLDYEQFGTFITMEQVPLHLKADYSIINRMAGISVTSKE